MFYVAVQCVAVCFIVCCSMFYSVLQYVLCCSAVMSDIRHVRFFSGRSCQSESWHLHGWESWHSSRNESCYMERHESCLLLFSPVNVSYCIAYEIDMTHSYCHSWHVNESWIRLIGMTNESLTFICVAVCCSVLQCVAVCRGVLQCVAVPHSWESLTFICVPWPTFVRVYVFPMQERRQVIRTYEWESWLTYECESCSFMCVPDSHSHVCLKWLQCESWHTCKKNVSQRIWVMAHDSKKVSHGTLKWLYVFQRMWVMAHDSKKVSHGTLKWLHVFQRMWVMAHMRMTSSNEFMSVRCIVQSDVLYAYERKSCHKCLSCPLFRHSYVNVFLDINMCLVFETFICER